MTDIAIPNAEELRQRAQDLTELLRLRTLPIGIRLFEDVAALDGIPGLRRSKKGAEFSTCRLVTQARIAGPCDAERRYGGVADDEMRMALRPQELRRTVEGLKGLSKAGLRYPIPPYGAFADPAEDMAKSYG